MSGNTYGKLFTVTTAGESHGPALVAIVDGCPPGVEISLEDLQRDLDRRKPGTSRHTTQRQEADEVEILSGVFEGRTTGCPIGLLIRNTDQKSKDYSAIKDLFRPAHADYTYHHKYGIRDYRGGGRSSARETAMRVAAGAIAKKYLTTLGIQVRGYMSQLGPIEIPFKTWDSVEQNAFFSPDPDKVPELEAYMDQLRRDQDSVGAKITVVAEGVMPGLGEPIFDRLDADLAHALMSINAVKGVEIGAGFASVEQRGTEHSDEMSPEGFLSNNAGGVLGGICLILALYALQLLPVNYAGVALILLGIAFMVAEAFLPSFGVLGIGGVAAFVAGAVILIDTEVPGFGIPLSLIVPLGFASALLVFAIVAMALKARRQRLVGGDAELIGSLAPVTGISAQDPHSGWVHLQGENWQVRSATPLQVGQQVRVVAREGLQLSVAAQPSSNREELNHGL